MNFYGIASVLLFLVSTVPVFAIGPTNTITGIQKTQEKPRNGCFQAVEPALAFTPGVGDELPKLYYLRPFTENTDEKPASAGSACLTIKKDGTTSLALFPRSLGQIADLNRESVVRIFGNPDATLDHPSYSTFHLIGSNKTEPNIFHLDIKFDDAQNLQAFRIRGFGISHAEWQ